MAISAKKFKSKTLGLIAKLICYKRLRKSPESMTGQFCLLPTADCPLPTAFSLYARYSFIMLI